VTNKLTAHYLLVPAIAVLSSFSVATAVIGCATQQSRAEREARLQQEVHEALDAKKLHIDILSMNTLRYGSRVVTPDFFVELIGDTLNSYLPYLGQAYHAPLLSSAQGLNFKKRAENIVQSTPKSNLTRLDISVRTSEDVYQYRIEIYDSGKAFIHVRSQYRDPVSYDGNLAVIH